MREKKNGKMPNLSIPGYVKGSSFLQLGHVSQFGDFGQLCPFTWFCTLLGLVIHLKFRCIKFDRLLQFRHFGQFSDLGQFCHLCQFCLVQGCPKVFICQFLAGSDVNKEKSQSKTSKKTIKFTEILLTFQLKNNFL